MKRMICFLLALSLQLPLTANEGMWLPLLLSNNIEEMQALGLKLSAEDIYSINNGSLKDAVVSFGGFCTGEIISDQGLILTNHHCGYSMIQDHSTPENNILKKGFWSKSLAEEIPNEGMYVRFLDRMEDVTNRVMDELPADISEADRPAKLRAIMTKIQKEAEEESGLEAEVKSFYHGNEFYLFVYRRYSDVRLVGTPPESIGKFGGDTDNWMWPRHTGDFSLFRVYTAPDGSASDYQEDNVPLKPKHHLPISLNGIEEGDFTMVMGFPGSTDRYLSSYGVAQAIASYNPSVVEVRDQKLAIMRSYMDEDEATEIQYADKYAQSANYWKYYIGQTEQLKGNRVEKEKRAIEQEFKDWLRDNPEMKEKYGEALTLLEEGYEKKAEYVKGQVYVREAGLLGAELPLFAARINAIMELYFRSDSMMEVKMDEAETDSAEAIAEQQFGMRKENLKKAMVNQAMEHYANYNSEMDEELMAELLQMYVENIPEEQLPEYLAEMADDYDYEMDEFAEELFEESILADSVAFMEFVEDMKRKDYEKDMGIKLGKSIYKTYQQYRQQYQENEAKLDKGYRLFTAGLREMQSDRTFYPDANSTMRVTYGTVGSYNPRDGVQYDYQTTADGVLQKYDPNDREFNAPKRLIQLIEQGDFNRYANDEGNLPVCFIHNTDITGGNSGSPVINGEGHLIGCAFDGNWEAMSGDIFFEDNLQRTISVDARYILFIIDEFANAHRLIQEMTIIDEDAEELRKKRMEKKNLMQEDM